MHVVVAWHRLRYTDIIGPRDSTEHNASSCLRDTVRPQGEHGRVVLGNVNAEMIGLAPQVELDVMIFFFFFQAEDGIRDLTVTGVQTCALPISFRPCSMEFCSSARSSPSLRLRKKDLNLEKC